MDVCYGNGFILNGKLQPCSAFNNSMIYEGESIYEVIRMSNGNPVFFHDHMERLERSVKFQDKAMLADREDLRRDLKSLSAQENLNEANLKIIFNYNNQSGNYLLYFIEPVYPTDYQYSNGVKGIFFKAERKDPASKVLNMSLRSDIFQKLIHEGAYEALLIDHRNCITEGSRSNIFFIRKDILYTAPENRVLSGITRKYILDLCHEQCIKVEFECIRADRIADYESVFMSGTSPVVLPFSQINDVPFDPKHPVMSELRHLYLKKSEDSIRRFISG